MEGRRDIKTTELFSKLAWLRWGLKSLFLKNLLDISSLASSIPSMKTFRLKPFTENFLI